MLLPERLRGAVLHLRARMPGLAHIHRIATLRQARLTPLQA